MHRKIPVEKLQLGMFLHELCGSWMDHPFWTTKFLLQDAADLERLRTSAVREVWIDTGRGLDIETGEQTVNIDAERARNEAALIAVAVGNAPVQQVPLDVEVVRAARICANAKTAVVSMFREARMGKAVEAALLEPLVEEISASVLRNPGALVSLARLKTADDYTYMHSVAVCGLMVSLARQLELDPAQTREAGMAGLIHDLGKAAIPLSVLNKPGKLTDEEFALVRNHPEEGHRMLLEGGGVGEIPLDVALHHHEKTDGSGYPHRLPDEAISLYAKMGAVCDVYDAITSNRPYKAGWDPAMSIRKMNEWANGHFDARVFQAFVKSVGIYPIGSLVRLASGQLAVVTELREQALLAPVVKVVYSLKLRQKLLPRELDLAQPGCTDRITGWESPAKWGLDDLDRLWAGDGVRH